MPVIPIRSVAWFPCYRVIPGRFPPVDHFERLAPASDWDALLELDGLTNDQLRTLTGAIRVIPPEERPHGPGAELIMAAFAQVTQGGARFTDGTFGAYYAARDRETALAEAIFHRTRFLGATRQRPLQLELQLLEARLSGELHDLRGLGAEFPGVYHPDDYAAARALARQLRGSGSAGVAYDSLRHAGGECAAIFRPSLLSDCRVTWRITCTWDGERVTALQEGWHNSARSAHDDEGGSAGATAA